MDNLIAILIEGIGKRLIKQSDNCPADIATTMIIDGETMMAMADEIRQKEAKKCSVIVR